MEDNQQDLIQLTTSINATERYKRYLQICSLSMPEPLTDLEIEVLDELYHSEGATLTTETRKCICENLNKSSSQLNNYVRYLRKKGVIQEDKIHPNLMIRIPKTETFTITINMKVII